MAARREKQKTQLDETVTWETKPCKLWTFIKKILEKFGKENQLQLTMGEVFFFVFKLKSCQIVMLLSDLSDTESMNV